MRHVGLVGALLLSASPAVAQLVSVQLTYPPAELKAGIEGTTGFEVDIAKSGKVTRCKVTQTSGNAELDKQTCAQLRNTGQFKPAIDQTGKPIKSTYASKLRWRIPRRPEATQPAQSDK